MKNKHEIKQCPFCHEYLLRFYKADDDSFCYVACFNKKCLTLGPLAHCDETDKEQTLSVKELKALAVKKWNQRKYNNYVKPKSVALQTKSHDEMFSC